MRLLFISLSLLSAANLRVCGKAEGGASASASSEAQAATAASAATAAKLSAAAPRIGGQIVAVGAYNVEVAVHESGSVEALVSDASGKLVQEGVRLAVTAQSKASAREKVELAFAAPRARFEGSAKAGVELTSGPVDVALDVAGKAASASFDAAVALPSPRFGGHVLTAGKFSAEVLIRRNGEVLAFVRDSAGAAIQGGAEFSVRVHTAAGAREEISLSFEAPRACFVGRAKAGVELGPGALELTARAGGKVSLGGLHRVSLTVDAAHGGQVVAVGDYSVELVVKGGQVSAFVFDATGKAAAAGDLDLALLVGAKADTSLALKWDAPTLSYLAQIKGDVDLSLEPIRVALSASGRMFFGGVASLKAAASAVARAKLDASAKVDANAKLAAAGDLNAKVQAPDIKANASAVANKTATAKAGVKIEPPKINLSATKSASAGTGAKTGAKASGGFSLGTK